VLGLAYAERYPERVSEMVLMGVTTGRRRETDLLTRGLGRLFPEAWARFRGGVPESDATAICPTPDHRLLSDRDPGVRQKAARDWCDWEVAIVPTSKAPNPSFRRPDFRMAFARIVTHDWRHGSWLEDGVVLREAVCSRASPASSSKAPLTSPTC
jgi:proline iminopeptidase